jgi:FtsH-binding integral membrane protein
MFTVISFNAGRTFDDNRYVKVNGFFSENHDYFNPAYFKNFHDLRPSVKQHLTKVYATLSCMLGATSLGVLLSMTDQYYPGPFLNLILALSSIYGLILTYNYPDSSPLRQALLLAFCLCQGISLSPLIYYSGDPIIILMAPISTFLVFASFTLCSLFSKRRSHLYLGSILSSATFILIGSFILNTYFNFISIYMLQLYGGLIIFCLYVVYNTQKNIEEANRGNKKVINQALALFTDIVAILINIVYILINKLYENGRKKARSGIGKSGVNRCYSAC